MRSATDRPFEIIFHPGRDEILVCAPLARDVLAEGLAMPYDAGPGLAVLADCERYQGTWRVEVWAENEREARANCHRQMRRRRGAA
jgi:hypothetical protein